MKLLLTNKKSVTINYMRKTKGEIFWCLTIIREDTCYNMPGPAPAG